MPRFQGGGGVLRVGGLGKKHALRNEPQLLCTAQQETDTGRRGSQWAGPLAAAVHSALAPSPARPGPRRARVAVISREAMPCLRCDRATASEVMWPCTPSVGSSSLCVGGGDGGGLGVCGPARCASELRLRPWRPSRQLVTCAGARGERAARLPPLNALNPHFGQHVAHDGAVIVLCHVKQLRPRQNVVEVVLRASGWARGLGGWHCGDRQGRRGLPLLLQPECLLDMPLAFSYILRPPPQFHSTLSW